jgi:hypothetical protein
MEATGNLAICEPYIQCMVLFILDINVHYNRSSVNQMYTLCHVHKHNFSQI